MKTLVKRGPTDHGRRLTMEEFEQGEYKRGWEYELIEGRLYVSPRGDFPQNWLENWFVRKLDTYSDTHRGIANFVANRARVFIPYEENETSAGPDLALYHNVPLERPIDEINWRNLHPFLVGEVLTEEEGADKDLVRNVQVFLHAKFIKEYWVLDGRENIEQPNLKVHRRSGRRWRIIDVPFGETYTTKLLPDFELLVNPRR